MEISDEIINELTKNRKTQEDFNELFRALKKRGLEAALSGELTEHLGYDKHERADSRKPNSRNGYSKKIVTTAQGKIDLNIPLDRRGTFEPQIIERYQIVSFTVPANIRSIRVMEKIGMRRDINGDFGPPHLPPDHKLSKHILYRLTVDEYLKVRK